MKTTSATVIVIFLESARELLDHSYVKFSSQQLKGTLKTASWCPTVEDFMEIDQDTC